MRMHLLDNSLATDVLALFPQTHKVLSFEPPLITVVEPVKKQLPSTTNPVLKFGSWCNYYPCKYFLPYSNSSVGFLAVVWAIAGCEEVFDTMLKGSLCELGMTMKAKFCELSFGGCGWLWRQNLWSFFCDLWMRSKAIVSFPLWVADDIVRQLWAFFCVL